MPDADLLIALSKALETPVSVLLGESVAAPEENELKALAERLEEINLQLARRKEARRRMLHWSLIALCAVIAAVFAGLIALESPYLGWDYGDPETAVVGVAMHAFEWVFVRTAPLVLIGAGIGIFLTGRKRKGR